MANKIPNEPHKAVLRTAVGATVLIAIGAFVLSFAALTDLAQRSGIEPRLAWIWPIIVDGMIVASTVAIVALNGHGRRAMIYPWSLLFFGAIVSTAANSVHAILTVDKMASGIPPIVSALVAAMPPVVLLAITHLTVHMYQKRAEVAQQRAEEEAIAEAEAAAHGYYSHEYDGGWPTEETTAAGVPGTMGDGYARTAAGERYRTEPRFDEHGATAVPAAPATPPRVAATAPHRTSSAGLVTAEGPAPLYDETVSALAAEDPEVLVQR